jgi:hypothetical protein
MCTVIVKEKSGDSGKGVYHYPILQRTHFTEKAMLLCDIIIKEHMLSEASDHMGLHIWSS